MMLGPFLLVARMGAGGMGSVYRALDTALNRFVAIKVMKASLGEDPALVASFIREAQAAAALNHRNIVQIYSCGTEQGQPYIVMELVSGGRLSNLFTAEKPMDEAALLKLAIDVADGLDAANAAGLVHGDIKPENVLIDEKGTAKIVDFGLAQFVNAQKDRGEIWGTPYYISPERARGNKADHRSDIYSLGATLFHALSGQPPFDGKTATDVVLARLKHPPPDLAALRPGLTPETVQAVKRMMAADPFLRYPNATSLRSDLQAALRAAKAPRGGVRHKKRSNTASWVVGGVAVLVLVALGYVLVGGYREASKAPPPAPPRSTTTPVPAVPAAPEEPAAPVDPLLSFVEVTGPDGKVRLRKVVTIFEAPQEVLLGEVAAALAAGDRAAAAKGMEALRRALPLATPRGLWVPLFDALLAWVGGHDAAAESALEPLVRATIKQKEDHPVHMPQVLARHLLGQLDDGELAKRRSEWPVWYGDAVRLWTGVRDLAGGSTADGQRNLRAYAEQPRTEPVWLQAFRPAARSWLQDLRDLDDQRGLVRARLEAGQTAAARDLLNALATEVPPMLGRPIEEGLARVAELEAAQRAVAEAEAARVLRQRIQVDLDRIDQALREVSPLLIRQRDYRKAALSLSTLPSAMETADGRAAAVWARKLVERLDRMKQFMIRSLDATPYRRADGSDLGGDVISATTLGVRVSLDGRSVNSIGWEEIPVKSFLRLADFAVRNERMEEGERAEALVGLAVFAVVNGAMEPATAFALRAEAASPELAVEVRRMLPGLPRDVP
jgi:hypothetical protein